jgi:hypothetical protein
LGVEDNIDITGNDDEARKGRYPHGSFPRRALGVALPSLCPFQDLPLAGSLRLRRRTTSTSPATEAIVDKISLDHATEISTKGTF